MTGWWESAMLRLTPLVTKQVIDHYLKPLLIGADPWDIEFLWQHMYRKTMAFGRKGIGDDGDQRSRHRAVGPARQVREATRLSPARWKNEVAHPGLCEPALLMPAGTVGIRSATIQK